MIQCIGHRYVTYIWITSTSMSDLKKRMLNLITHSLLTHMETECQ